MSFLKISLIPLAFASQIALASAASAQKFDVSFTSYQYMFDKINEFRQQNGLPRVKAHPGPGAVAEAYAYYLAETNQAGHYDDGLGPEGRMAAAKDAEPEHGKGTSGRQC